MTYAFEDYDAFLASFADKDNFQPNPPLSTSLSADGTDAEFNSFYGNEIQQEGLVQQQPQQNFNAVDLSPELTSVTSSSSPHEMQKVNSAFPEFDFISNNVMNNTEVPLVKQESFSDMSSSASPNDMPHYGNTNLTAPKSVRITDAVPHSACVSKRGAKKEKSSHNMIEKRYRTNINDKILALRDSVPALRVLVESGDDDIDELDGLQPAKKLNKATILSKATEYIKHLENKNDSLKKENDQLKARLYGGNISPGSSVSSYSSISENNNGMSLTNKVLLGGLACMVGSGLSEDFNSESRSLFAMPIFGFGAHGSQSIGKSFVVLLKVAAVFTVLLTLVFPSLFSKKRSKKENLEESFLADKQIDDVRCLPTASIWSTFSLKKGHTNTEYVKSAIFRAVLLKTRYFHAHPIIKSLISSYTSHLWSYLLDIKLDDTLDSRQLKSILSLDHSETINNEEYISELVNYDVSLLQGDDGEDEIPEYSVSALLYRMMNESRTNIFLKKFMVDSVNTDKSIPEIETSLVPETDEYNVELTTLFKPEEEQIEKFKQVLESWDLASIKQDDILVLYSSIIQNLIFEKRDFASAKKWFGKIDNTELTKFNLLGFTSLYIVVLSMISHPDLYTNDKDVVFKIEQISAQLRIWLGNSSGSVLNFKKRSLLIDFFVNVNLKINGIEGVRDDVLSA